MMTLTNIITRVCSRLNKNVNDTTVTARITNHINDACQEKWLNYQWSFRWREYPIVLSPQVTDTSSSSTLTATNGSPTVTSTGTPFLSARHVGQWLRFTTDSIQNWYRIITVNSTSSITVEPAYQGTSGGSKAFQLVVTDYDLPLDITDLGKLKITYSGAPLEVQHNMQMDGYFQPPLSAGYPYGVALYINDFTAATYSTGTLTSVVNTNTLTGSGTAWLSNVLPGDEIVLTGDTNTYRVQSVTSDTSLALYNKVTLSLAGVAYTVTRQYQQKIRVQPAPDQAYVCFAKGLRNYNPLINSADTNEFLLRFPYAVIEAAVWREASSSPDSREDSLYMKSEKLWAQAQSDDTEILPQTNYAPIFDARNFYR